MKEPTTAGLEAATTLRNTIYQDLLARQQVPRTPTQARIPRHHTPAPSMSPANRAPALVSPLVPRSVPVPHSKSLTPSRPSRHPTAYSIVDAPSPVSSPVAEKYLVILDGKRPGVYRLVDPNVPVSTGSTIAIIDGLANADHHFVTQYMRNNVRRDST